MTATRPARPALPEPVILAGEILGAQLEPLHRASPAQIEAYRSALRQLEGRQVYVISAAELDEITARQRSYVLQLEAAPFWRSSP